MIGYDVTASTPALPPLLLLRVSNETGSLVQTPLASAALIRATGGLLLQDNFGLPAVAPLDQTALVHPGGLVREPDFVPPKRFRGRLFVVAPVREGMHSKSGLPASQIFCRFDPRRLKSPDSRRAGLVRKSGASHKSVCWMGMAAVDGSVSPLRKSSVWALKRISASRSFRKAVSASVLRRSQLLPRSGPAGTRGSRPG